MYFDFEQFQDYVNYLKKEYQMIDETVVRFADMMELHLKAVDENYRLVDHYFEGLRNYFKNKMKEGE